MKNDATKTEVKCPCCGRMVKASDGYVGKHFVDRTNLGGGLQKKACRGSWKRP